MQINDSPNISILDSRVTIDTKNGNFVVGLQPSVFIGSGASNVQGASIRIKSPYGGILIKDYPSSGFDITPPNMATGVVTVPIPKSVNTYRYGIYDVSVLLTDTNGKTYETPYKSVKVCPPDSKDKQKKYGSLSARLDAACKDGRLYVIADGIPSYNAALPYQETYNLSLKYPYGALAEETGITSPKFSVKLFEGQYKLEGSVDAEYSFGDNVYAIVLYNFKKEKDVRCLIDKSCIAERLSQLVDQMNSDCTSTNMDETNDTIIKTILLLEAIDSGVEAGYDVSDLIDQMESILGCVCTCNCAEGTPVGTATPTGDFDIQGCGVTKVVNGLTTTFTINNYEYTMDTNANGGVISISSPSVAGCQVNRTISYNEQKAYEKIKSLINNTNEFNFWAAVIKASLAGVDVSCLGITPSQFNAMSFKSFIQSILTALCSGAKCNATIDSVSISNSGSNVTLHWTSTSAFEVSVYVDGISVGNVLSDIQQIVLEGYADGSKHNYTIIARCDSGAAGNAAEGEFEYFGCPVIAIPNVTTGSVMNANCPYDLNSIVNNIPSGITIEWHTANDTSSGTIVASPSSVGSGTYYAFAKNSDGCYSDSFKVVITCAGSSNCTAPQNMTVDSITSGVRIRFQSSSAPPPSNSYNVQRRKQSDADIPANYVNLGSATWNASVSRWEVIDTTATVNEIYVYRAIANCVSSQPYVDYIFAYIACVVASLTATQNSIAYSFPSSSSITKYDVILYAANGVTQIDKQTINPAFPATITGTFNTLLLNTDYKVKVVSWIGAYQNNCVMQNIKTQGESEVILIYGIMKVGDTGTTIKVYGLSQTITCSVIFTIPFVYTLTGVDHSSSATVEVTPGSAGGENAVTMPVGAVLKEIGVANVMLLKDCNAISYQYSLSREASGGGQYLIEFGYTELDTTGATPTEAEYLASIVAPTSPTSMKYINIGDPLEVDFPNTIDKVCFIKVPASETVKSLWSEIGNPLQQNQPIDPSYGSGSNVFFASPISGGAGGYYYITRSQTTFGGTIKLD